MHQPTTVNSQHPLSAIPMAAAVLPFLIIFLLQFQIQFRQGAAQQAYLNNKQYNCSMNSTNTLGYSCNGPASCTSYFTFRAIPPYSTVPSIAFLLSADADSIASANNVTDVSSFPENHLLYVPVPCSCATTAARLRYYQHNANYTIKVPHEVYEDIANGTYEGLTTCQALIAQNHFPILNLSVGDVLLAPLMCACPSANQTRSGFKYVLSYLLTWGETISGVADLFGVDQQAILDANQLTPADTIFPFNPLLVPLKTTPDNIKLNPSSSPPPPPPPPPPVKQTGSSKKWVFVGIGIGAAVVALPILFLLAFLLCRRKRKQPESAAAAAPPPPPQRKGPVEESLVGYEALPGDTAANSNSWSVSSDGVKYAIESLTVYKFEAIHRATRGFSDSTRISGSSVYRGEFNGDAAAVKVLNGDVSVEINILKQINHSNIIRLSGFCAHDGDTYLVYEYAEKGSLRALLAEPKDPPSSSSLGWKQRVQVAYGIGEGLNYLHNYCNPPYVHKNLSSSNVVLDASFRAKITNFGLARTVEEEEDGDGGHVHLTKHVVGTKGYLAPEYIDNGLVTPKMDVYAFGVVLLELLSGRIAADKASMLSAASVREVLEGEGVREKLRRFMDGGLGSRYPIDLAYSTAQLAKMCVEPDLNSRPSISEVLGLLSKIHSSSLDWDPEDELDRSASLTHGR